MPDKLTDSEIVKALECCIKTNTIGDCKKMSCPAFTLNGCSYYLRTDEDSVGAIFVEIIKDALDLINRLQAENEKLKKVKYIFSTVDYCESDLAKALKENEELKSAINGFRDYEHKIKAEAYKEFAERLANKAMLPQEINDDYAVGLTTIKKTLKELVGDDK